jgi:hypothetical protein
MPRLSAALHDTLGFYQHLRDALQVEDNADAVARLLGPRALVGGFFPYLLFNFLFLFCGFHFFSCNRKLFL